MMVSKLDSLIFDIDIDELTDLQELYEATEGQLIASYNRSLARTAVTLKKLGGQLIRDEVKAKNLKAIRRRLQQYRVRKAGGLGELKLWFGLNDLPVSALKGRLSKSSDGAVFTPVATDIGTQSYPGAFVAKNGKRRSIFQRKGKQRWPVREAQVSIKHLQEAIEDDVFDQLPEIFIHHLESDLKGRVKQGIESKWY